MNIIIYIFTQLMNVWIFLGQKVMTPLGLEIKPHAVIFLVATLASFYYIAKHFNKLWSYTPFRYLFLFFILSTFYAFFYKTDFRSSSYIDLWIHNNLGLRHSAIQSGLGEVSREFGSGETKYLIYLIGLAPLVAFVTGFMVSINKPKLQNIINFLSFGMLFYFILLGISILTGTTTVMSIEGRLSFDGGFTGGDFEGLLLIMMLGFCMLKQSVKWPIITNMIILLVLITLGIKKGTIIALLIAGLFVGCLVLGRKIYRREKLSLDFNPALLVVPLMLVALPLLIAPDSFESLVYNIADRFQSNETLNVRMINWELYSQYWYDNLDFLKALFGFGIDTSRETIFFLSAMHPDPSMQQPHIHNIFLEMFYNYGLMALLFFLPLFSIFMNNLKAREKNAFNYIAIAAIVFFVTFFMTESPAFPSIILIFSLLGFLEAVRRSSIEHKEESPVPN